MKKGAGVRLRNPGAACFNQMHPKCRAMLRLKQTSIVINTFLIIYQLMATLRLDMDTRCE